tara:strand:- start:23272 stop:24246 length:975 start_codon:yes stop_codon:yes gene_type:complete
MSDRKVYINRNFTSELNAKISIYDSALMFGDMVFEMTRSFNKVQFKLEEHIERLFLSAKNVSIDIQYTVEEIVSICNQLVEMNINAFEKDDEHRLMINLTRGPLSIYNSIDDLVDGPNLIISDFPLKWTVQSMAPLFSEGINVVITNQKIIPAYLLDPKIKSRSRLHYMQANIEVSKIKGKNNWALLTDTDGFIAEGTGSNFLIVKNNKIISPEPRNILRGISLDYVKFLSKKNNIPFIEKNIDRYDVLNADEAFMTGTPFCMLPVMSLDQNPIGDGKRGKIFDLLLKSWNEEVGLDVEQQIKNWNKNFKDNITITPYAFNKNK